MRGTVAKKLRAIANRIGRHNAYTVKTVVKAITIEKFNSAGELVLVNGQEPRHTVMWEKGTVKYVNKQLKQIHKRRGG